MTIDYLKMFVDPILTAGFRWEKSFSRYYALQKYYPIRLSKKEIKFNNKITSDIYDELEKFPINNKTIIITGFQSYNIYIDVSKINKPHIKPIQLPYFEFVSIDYENDVKKLLDILQKFGKTSMIEYYPFFTFLNFRTEIFVNDKLVVKIYQNLHNLCFSYVTHKNMMVGSFHFNLRLCHINANYCRANDDRDNEQLFYDMASHLIQMRRNYLDGTDNTIFSDTIFRDFGVNCIGFTQNEKIERNELFKRNKKRHIAFKYTPNETKIDTSIWIFSNSSGNKIHNIKNYKIHFENNDVHVKLEEDDNKKENKKIINDVKENKETKKIVADT